VLSITEWQMLWGWLPVDWVYISHLFVRVISSANGHTSHSLKQCLTKLAWVSFRRNYKLTKNTIQINHQPGATIFQFIILMFIYSWTCFGRFPAHHQELNDCSGSLWFYLRIVFIVVLCFRGRAGPTTNTARKLENCCIWLVIYLNFTMMHRTNVKFNTKYNIFNKPEVSSTCDVRLMDQSLNILWQRS
jgi:hypothetical protein